MSRRAFSVQGAGIKIPQLYPGFLQVPVSNIPFPDETGFPARKEPSLDVIKGLYELRNRDEIYAILRENEFLTPLLVETHAKIHEYFPEAEGLYLATFPYEEVFAPPALSLYIKVRLSAKEAIGRLRRFDEGWWLANVPRADGLLCIDVVRI